jgi:hypothetical protein
VPGDLVVDTGVLSPALIPSRMGSQLLVRVDEAGASHELITHLPSLSPRRRTVLFTCGWADHELIRRSVHVWSTPMREPHSRATTG